jgi:putative FmdB family regulatory protein
MASKQSNFRMREQYLRWSAQEAQVTFAGQLRAEDRAMPTYEYRCDKCGKEFTRIESISTHGRKKIPCPNPKCKSTHVSQVFTPFYAKTVKKS